MADAVAERMDRQRVLTQAGHRFEFVIEEPVLRFRFCAAGILRKQLLHLRETSRLAQVSLGIIPQHADRRRVLPREGFVMFDADLVSVELVPRGAVSDPAGRDRHVPAGLRRPGQHRRLRPRGPRAYRRGAARPRMTCRGGKPGQPL